MGIRFKAHTPSFIPLQGRDTRQHPRMTVVAAFTPRHSVLCLEIDSISTMSQSAATTSMAWREKRSASCRRLLGRAVNADPRTHLTLGLAVLRFVDRIVFALLQSRPRSGRDPRPYVGNRSAKDDPDPQSHVWATVSRKRRPRRVSNEQPPYAPAFDLVVAAYIRQNPWKRQNTRDTRLDAFKTSSHLSMTL